VTLWRPEAASVANPSVVAVAGGGVVVADVVGYSGLLRVA
jgi:hypothetical protein